MVANVNLKLISFNSYHYEMSTHSLFPARYTWEWGFPDGSAGKESTCNAGDTGYSSLIPGLGRSPRGGNGDFPVFLPGKSQGQSSLEATVHGAAKSMTGLRVSARMHARTHTHTHTHT